MKIECLSPVASGLLARRVSAHVAALLVVVAPGVLVATLAGAAPRTTTLIAQAGTQSARTDAGAGLARNPAGTRSAPTPAGTRAVKSLRNAQRAPNLPNLSDRRTLQEQLIQNCHRRERAGMPLTDLCDRLLYRNQEIR